MNTKTYFGSILALLLIYGSVFGQAFPLPNQKLVGSDKVTPGSLAVVAISPIDTPPKGLQEVTYKWMLSENGKEKMDFLEWPDKQKIFFGAGMPEKDTTYTVTVMVGYLYVNREKDDPKGNITGAGQRINLLTHTVFVPGLHPNPGPGPDPNPNPDPDPTPTFPDGKYGLSKLAYQWARTKVSGNDRKAAPELVKSFQGMASTVAAGTVTSVEDFLKKSKEANTSALSRAGVSPAGWDAFGTALQDHIYELYHDRKTIQTAQDFAIAWNEVAAGLEKVR
jgi:hypothetical protein